MLQCLWLSRSSTVNTVSGNRIETRYSLLSRTIACIRLVTFSLLTAQVASTYVSTRKELLLLLLAYCKRVAYKDRSKETQRLCKARIQIAQVASTNVQGTVIAIVHILHTTRIFSLGIYMVTVKSVSKLFFIRHENSSKSGNLDGLVEGGSVTDFCITVLLCTIVSITKMLYHGLLRGTWPILTRPCHAILESVCKKNAESWFES